MLNFLRIRESNQCRRSFAQIAVLRRKCLTMRFMPSRFVRTISGVCALLLLAPLVQSDTRPLPQDQGALHLYQLLLKLKTTARFMQVVAHPDDEDGGLLTLESRGKGASVLLFTLNRGEGGQ